VEALARRVGTPLLVPWAERIDAFAMLRSVLWSVSNGLTTVYDELSRANEMREVVAGRRESLVEELKGSDMSVGDHRSETQTGMAKLQGCSSVRRAIGAVRAQ